MMGAPLANEELGTSDEIKEFKHEGEETSSKEVRFTGVWVRSP